MPYEDIRIENTSAIIEELQIINDVGVVKTEDVFLDNSNVVVEEIRIM